MLNPFTPYGDCSLIRMANLYANAAHAAISDFDTCLDLVTDLPARLMNLGDYGIEVGNPADLVILDTDSGPGAIANLYVAGTGGVQVPLSALVKVPIVAMSKFLCAFGPRPPRPRWRSKSGDDRPRTACGRSAAEDGDGRLFCFAMQSRRRRKKVDRRCCARSGEAKPVPG